MRAVIYTRVSLDREGTKASPETQEAECRAYCVSKGWDVLTVHCDRDRSAFKKGAKREAFDRMLAAVTAGHVDAVVAYKLDRLTRGGIAGLVPILDVLGKAKAKLALVHDNVDTSTALGEGLLGLLASFGKQESENISRRVKSASEAAAKRGDVPSGGSRQFGYQRDGSVIESEASAIREVVARLLAGESLRRVAFDLNERGIRTTQENHWSSQTLGQMVRSPRLASLRIVDQEAVAGSWEPILSRDEHVRLLGALARPPAARRAVRRHLLTGLIVCGVCEQPLKTMGWRQKNGRKFPRYQCVKQPGYSNCGHIAVTKESLDKYVVDQTLAFLAAGYLLPLSDDGDRLDQIRADIAQDRENLRQLTEDRYVNRAIPEDAYVPARDRLTARIDALEEQVTALEHQREALSPLQGLRGSREGLQAWWDQATIEEKRTALGESISQVVIHPAKRRGGNQFDTTRVEIRWKWHLFTALADAEWEGMSENEQQEAIEEAHHLLTLEPDRLSQTAG